MKSIFHDDDYVSRVSTGKAASESYRRERRNRAIRAALYCAAGAAIVVLAIVARSTPANATVERPDQFPPGPVCPFGDDVQRYCL